MNIPKYSKLFVQIVPENNCPGNVHYPLYMVLGPLKVSLGWHFWFILFCWQDVFPNAQPTTSWVESVLFHTDCSPSTFCGYSCLHLSSFPTAEMSCQLTVYLIQLVGWTVSSRCVWKSGRKSGTVARIINFVLFIPLLVVLHATKVLPATTWFICWFQRCIYRTFVYIICFPVYPFFFTVFPTYLLLWE